MSIDVDDVDPATYLGDVEMRVGEVTGAEPCLYELEVDFGGETRPAAGLTDDCDPGDLIGRRVSPSSTSIPPPSPGSRAGVSSPGSPTAKAGSSTSSRGADRRPGVLNGSGVQ
jgi:hypothetical protein